MKLLMIVAVAGLAGGCGDNTKVPSAIDAKIPSPDAPSGRTPVEQGRYIMNTLGACTFCHTPLNPDGTRDQTRLFAGVDCFIDIDPTTAGFGCISSRNLTNDATGLKNATDTQIKNAITNGMRTDGKTLASLMPYWVFHNMSDNDVDAIVAYIRTIPAVTHTVTPNEAPWSMMNDNGPAATPIDPSEIPMPIAGPNQASAMRGRYLSSMAGLCIDCHTPDLAPGGIRPIDITKAYAGGRQFFAQDLGLQSPPYPAMLKSTNLTSDATGLMGFSVADIKKSIADGKDKLGNAVCAATHGSGISPYAALDAADLEDIANYVASLPPVANNTGPDCMGPPVP